MQALALHGLGSISTKLQKAPLSHPKRCKLLKIGRCAPKPRDWPGSTGETTMALPILLWSTAHLWQDLWSNLQVGRHRHLDTQRPFKPNSALICSIHYPFSLSCSSDPGSNDQGAKQLSVAKILHFQTFTVHTASGNDRTQTHGFTTLKPDVSQNQLIPLFWQPHKICLVHTLKNHLFSMLGSGKLCAASPPTFSKQPLCGNMWVCSGAACLDHLT